MQTFKVVKTDKQKEAIRMIGGNLTTLLEGGSRSGKTFIAVYAIIVRALRHDKTDHLICRFRFNHAKQSICFQTLPKVLEAMGIASTVKLNRTDWIYQFANGSKIWIGGLDDKERTEKILGLEYATIYLNEASQISYDSYETILTRLNPPNGVTARMLIDYNPPSIQHWGYKIFHNRKFPDGSPVPDGNFAKIKMNPKDNPNNSPQYLKTLETLSAAKRKRFVEGDYSLDSGSLWKRGWIKYGKAPIDLVRVVVGVDPAGTTNGDEIGIIVSAKDSSGMYWILDDYSCHGSPAEWASEVRNAYERYSADVVVAEKNYGGDMVEHTIRTACQNVNVKLINSSRGKIVRAEPISAMYEQGKVTHAMVLPALEDEYCIYDADSDFSPGRLDAAVFGLTELSSGTISTLDVI
jgi:hypothetical protein